MSLEMINELISQGKPFDLKDLRLRTVKAKEDPSKRIDTQNLIANKYQQGFRIQYTEKGKKINVEVVIVYKNKIKITDKHDQYVKPIGNQYILLRNQRVS